MSLDPCPHCGKDFDHNNAGARQNHIDACPYNPENMPDGAASNQGAQEAPNQPTRTADADRPPHPPQHPQADQTAQPPAQQPQQSQGQGQPPAVQQNDAIQTGLQLGQTAQQLTGADRLDIVQAAGAGLVSWAQQEQQREQAQRERARNTSNEQIRQNESYPDCPNCGRALTNIPPGDGPVEFNCQNCGEPLVAD